jgi:hypothetical protein
MKSANLLLVLGCLGSLLACGDLGDDDNAPLAVIQGQLSSQSTMSATPSNARVAVIWNTGTTGFKTSMDVAASPVFPSKFRLELRDPPPSTSMEQPSEPRPTDPTTDHPGFGFDQQSRPLTNKSGSGSYAIGSVVAYEDLDGDGRLGLIDANTPPTDRILGANEELLVVYIEGDANPFETPAPKRGYNLYRSPRCTKGTRETPPVCPPGSWVPISTEYELPLTAEPQLAEKMCNALGQESTASANKLTGPAPAPGPNGWPDRNDPNLVCSPDGKSYDIFDCYEVSQGLCKGTDQGCNQSKWTLPSTTPPPEWPCTIQ